MCATCVLFVPYHFIACNSIAENYHLIVSFDWYSLTIRICLFTANCCQNTASSIIPLCSTKVVWKRLHKLNFKIFLTGGAAAWLTPVPVLFFEIKQLWTFAGGFKSCEQKALCSLLQSESWLQCLIASSVSLISSSADYVTSLHQKHKAHTKPRPAKT